MDLRSAVQAGWEHQLELLRALRPDLKVLFTTGYARDAIVHDGRLDPGVVLIPKPFTYAAVAAKLSDILDAPPGKPRVVRRSKRLSKGST